MTEIFLAESSEVKKDRFSICYRQGDQYVVRFEGGLKDLPDQWAASGITQMLLKGYIMDFEDGTHTWLCGQDVYFIVNPENIPDNLREDDDYDPQ